MAKRVLIVDDDENLQETIQDFLRLEGYEVAVAANGLEALQRISDGLPELILLDMMMPRMDGYAFADELRRRGLHPGAPILVFTADGRAKEKAERVGALGYIQKPFDLDALLSAIERHTGG